MLNNRGPKILPWGTPRVIWWVSDNSPFTWQCERWQLCIHYERHSELQQDFVAHFSSLVISPSFTNQFHGKGRGIEIRSPNRNYCMRNEQWIIFESLSLDLYLVRLKIFEWIKILRRHLHQIQGNWAGRSFVTESRVNSRLITHAKECKDESEIHNCQRTQLSNNKFFNGILGVRLTWLDSKHRSCLLFTLQTCFVPKLAIWLFLCGKRPI